ncbi:MAG: citrate lyase subunit alpha [Fretibacterium sp.]|nr:citrate lyase subunit alpha [Fretibacterium sp.]
MKNAVGREIPESLLKNQWKEARGGKGYEVYQGRNYRDGTYIRKQGPRTAIGEKPQESKLLPSVREAVIKSGLKDGMTVSFHHHFRDGDYIVNMVMKEIVDLGIKDITIAASSLGSAHDPIADYIEQGIVTGIQTSGIRGRIGDVVSHGKLKTPAILRSHGGRVRAVEEGDVHIDVAFIGAPTSDEYGNARALGGKSDCGVLSYSAVDAQYADKVVVITDTLKPFPNFPASIHGIDVDYVVKVDEIGNPKKIASAAARMTQNPRDLMMAEATAKIMAATPWFRDGFSFQTGAGGPSLAVNRFIEPLMNERNIKMSWAVGGITGPICDLLRRGLVGTIVDTQDFDVAAIDDIRDNPNHYEISASEYANPANKGAFVNKLDFVILAALEVDVDFNVNVITGSDGVLRGAPGGHPDTAAGAKCCIIVTPLTRGRMATICEKVVTVTTPGECVDVVVTDYGVAVNPKRQDIIEYLDRAGIRHMPIKELQEKAYSMVGRPEELQWKDKVVAILEARDGTILDVVREIKPYSL